jgi:hypothetical protein
MTSNCNAGMHDVTVSGWERNAAVILLATGLAILLFCACATPRAPTPEEIQTRNKQCFDSVALRARTGDAVQQQQLAYIYRDGRCGVQKDLAEARKWLTSAADGGNRNAQLELAGAYQNGYFGIAPDAKEAAARYRTLMSELALTRDPVQSTLRCLAAFNLGTLYEDGRLPPPDMAQAISLYEQAAVSPNNAARSRLSSIYENGKGVPRNLVEAYKWRRLATVPGRGELDRLAKLMTPEQLSEAAEAAQAWLDAHKQEGGGR